MAPFSKLLPSSLFGEVKAKRMISIPLLCRALTPTRTESCSYLMVEPSERLEEMESSPPWPDHWGQIGSPCQVHADGPFQAWTLTFNGPQRSESVHWTSLFSSLTLTKWCEFKRMVVPFQPFVLSCEIGWLLILMFLGGPRMNELGFQIQRGQRVCSQSTRGLFHHPVGRLLQDS